LKEVEGADRMNQETVLRRDAWTNRGCLDALFGRMGHTIECAWCGRGVEIDFEAPKLPSGWLIKDTWMTDWKYSMGYVSTGGNHIFCSQECCDDAEWEYNREPWEPRKRPR